MLGVSLTITGMRVCCLAPARDHLDVFRHLADGRAHAALAHAVRAAEVELDAVAPVSSTSVQDRLPALLLAGHHQRDDQRAVRPVALDLLDLAEVDLAAARSVISSMLLRPISRRSPAWIAP